MRLLLALVALAAGVRAESEPILLEDALSDNATTLAPEPQAPLEELDLGLGDGVEAGPDAGAEAEADVEAEDGSGEGDVLIGQDPIEEELAVESIPGMELISAAIKMSAKLAEDSDDAAEGSGEEEAILSGEVELDAQAPLIGDELPEEEAEEIKAPQEKEDLPKEEEGETKEEEAEKALDEGKPIEEKKEEVKEEEKEAEIEAGEELKASLKQSLEGSILEPEEGGEASVPQTEVDEDGTAKRLDACLPGPCCGLKTDRVYQEAWKIPSRTNPNDMLSKPKGTANYPANTTFIVKIWQCFPLAITGKDGSCVEFKEGGMHLFRCLAGSFRHAFYKDFKIAEIACGQCPGGPAKLPSDIGLS